MEPEFAAGGFGGDAGGAGAAPRTDDKIYRLLEDVDDVKEQMHHNIDSVLENQEKLETLEDKTEQLKISGSQFKKGAVHVKKKEREFFASLVVGIAIGLCVLFMLILMLCAMIVVVLLGSSGLTAIILAIVFAVKNKNDGSS